MPEWIEFHALPEIGFEHFFIYDDNSDDELNQVLCTTAPVVLSSCTMRTRPFFYHMCAKWACSVLAADTLAIYIRGPRYPA